MFRSAASLIAKKTAIVAITGVTVIGGATFALAVEGEQPPAEEVGEVTTCTDDLGNTVECPVTPEEPTCTDDLGAVIDCPTEPEAPTTCTDDLGAVIDCPAEPEAPTTCTDDLGAVIDCPAEPEADTDVDLEEPAGEQPDNHGAAVSQAAKDCKTDMGEAKNHGQCVREVARSNAGKGAEAPAEETVTEAPVTEEPAPVVTEEPAADTMTAPAEKPAKGNAGGNGKGKGKA